ncbi:MAG TPA: hypothetical protein VMS17_05525 [Gemmataceae bacterium]|nr:hypothetical protein [Gemmataceae bacterium]
MTASESLLVLSRPSEYAPFRLRDRRIDNRLKATQKAHKRALERAALPTWLEVVHDQLRPLGLRKDARILLTPELFQAGTL